MWTAHPSPPSQASDIPKHVLLVFLLLSLNSISVAHWMLTKPVDLILCERPQTQWVDECNRGGLSRRQHFLALISILRLFHSFCPSSSMFPKPWGGDISAAFRAEHSTATYFQHLEQLWVFRLIVAICREKILQRLRAALVYCYDHAYLLESMSVYHNHIVGLP